MLTRSKARVFKLKTFQAQLSFLEPKKHKEAFLIFEWKDAITKNFNALLANGMWELVTLPMARKQ